MVVWAVLEVEEGSSRVERLEEGSSTVAERLGDEQFELQTKEDASYFSLSNNRLLNILYSSYIGQLEHLQLV